MAEDRPEPRGERHVRSEQPSLASPPPAADLADFPSLSVVAGAPVYRVARRRQGPWWFGSSGGGRFDLDPPRGTCYLAEDPLGALLEVLGPVLPRAVSTAFFDTREVRPLALPRAVELADFTARRAAGFGITGEISIIVPYDVSRAWARALAEAGFDGLRYRLRHDPAGSCGIALFGPAGERRHWARGRGTRVDAALLRRLREDCGVRVESPPRTDQLRHVDG